MWLTYGVFTQKFTHFDEVTLDASSIGLQMPDRADVKIRGVIVGEVLGFSATDEGAKIRLGIDPGQMDSIPSNVTGAIVPKTLFGEKYVSLVVPDSPATGHLQAGADDHAHERAGRGAEGARGPLPPPAHGPAGRPEPHPQRHLHGPRGTRRRPRP